MTEPTKEGVAARIEELEARAAALVEYGNSLPDGVTTEAFAEASLLRDEARKLRAAEGVAAKLRECECDDCPDPETCAELESCEPDPAVGGAMNAPARRRPFRRRPPLRWCVCGCGGQLRSWSKTCYLTGHAPTLTTAASLGVTSLRSYLRERNGRCAVCGGPFPDGSGCEFCPKVDL